MTAATIDEVVQLYERYGAQHYDEELSQQSHAEQTAALARASGASDALVVAALLHDVGHLLEMADAGERDRTVDQQHEARGAAWLAGLFPTSVTAPIALHVRAKRYGCAVDPSYRDVLSAGSVASLHRQGGPMPPTEVLAFETNPGWQDAVALRHWDDEGKVLDLAVPSLPTYRGLLEAVHRRAAAHLDAPDRADGISGPSRRGSASRGRR